MSGDGWRWVYYFNAIFFGSSSVLMSGLYRPPPTRLFREFSIAEMLKSIDFVGITLLLASVIGLVMSLTWGGHTYPWDSSRVVALLVAGSGLLVAFCIYGLYDPLVVATITKLLQNGWVVVMDSWIIAFLNPGTSFSFYPSPFWMDYCYMG